MYCQFVTKLSILRKSSSESVDNALVENKFKEHMHVTRSVEDELRDVLRKINSNQNKCLLLLCGSAGDGKSHMLSYLKYSDSEKLLDDFELYNDATESSAPNMTAIDTLASALHDFNDENFDNSNDKKMVVAINIGTLVNFIESEQGKAFKKLKEYVVEAGIASGENLKQGYTAGSVFQHVSFSDYQVFTLTEKGVKTEYLEKLFSKVFESSKENTFYQAYCDNSNCTMASSCPIRMNYEFLMDSEVRKSIINKIVEVVVEDKTIVSTRDILNLIYEILVHPDFDYQNLCNAASSNMNYLTKCIPWTTPMLIDEFEDVSPLLDSIRKHDILKIRQEKLDKETTSFHAMDNIKDVFDSITEDTSYKILNSITGLDVLGGKKPELKKVVYRFLVRLNELKNDNDNKHSTRLKEFLKYVYFQTCGKEYELAKIYEMTHTAAMKWNGIFPDGDICIDASNNTYWLAEQIDLQPCIYGLDVIEKDEINRFPICVKLCFNNAANESAGKAEITVDYSLFELISDICDGYRPTIQDKNHHADFDAFVQRITELGNKKSKVTIYAKNNMNEKYTFEKDPFGKYTFKVV